MQMVGMAPKATQARTEYIVLYFDQSFILRHVKCINCQFMKPSYPGSDAETAEAGNKGEPGQDAPTYVL